MARVREQGGGLGSPIRHDASFMSGSNASYGNGSRSRASGKVPTPPLFSSDEVDRDKPEYTEHVFEWVRCMRDYVEFNETDEIRQAQLAVSYLKGSAEAAERAHMAKRDSTWQSLQAYLLTTMITPAHVARLRRELNSFEAMRGKSSVKGMVEKFQVLERKINSLPEVHKKYCTMHWCTMLEYLKEGLPEGCVATLNQSPPESMEAAHEEILSWARAHQPLPDTPTPARLQFVQDEGVECEDCGEVFAIGEKCYKCGGMGHYARDVECPQHPNHTAQHPNHTAPPFTFAGAQTRTGGGFRGGGRAERRGGCDHPRGRLGLRPRVRHRWFGAHPRCVLRREGLHIARRLRRTIRQGGFELTWDRAFREVIQACAADPQLQHGHRPHSGAEPTQRQVEVFGGQPLEARARIALQPADDQRRQRRRQRLRIDRGRGRAGGFGRRTQGLAQL